MSTRDLVSKVRDASSVTSEALLILSVAVLLRNYGFQSVSVAIFSMIFLPPTVGFVARLGFGKRSSLVTFFLYVFACLTSTTSQIRTRLDDDLHEVTGIEFSFLDYSVQTNHFLVLATFAICLLFLVGSSVGNRVMTKRGSPERSAAPSRDAVPLRNPTDTDKSIDRFSKVLTAISPLLTFLAAIVGAILTYLAAVHGNPVGK